MFTGIIEGIGKIVDRKENEGNLIFEISSDIKKELKVDQSVSHSGICLTVDGIKDQTYSVTAIEETRQKTNIDSWIVGGLINLERCMTMGGRLDGHIVQGHVDEIGKVEKIEDKGGSKIIRIRYKENSSNVTVEKGSIAINGISLTVFDVEATVFSVAIIPYTWTHTNMKELTVGDNVNLEFDILGKYVKRLLPQK